MSVIDQVAPSEARVRSTAFNWQIPRFSSQKVRRDAEHAVKARWPKRVELCAPKGTDARIDRLPNMKDSPVPVFRGIDKKN